MEIIYGLITFFNCASKYSNHRTYEMEIKNHLTLHEDIKDCRPASIYQVVSQTGLYNDGNRQIRFVPVHLQITSQMKK